MSKILANQYFFLMHIEESNKINYSEKKIEQFLSIEMEGFYEKSLTKVLGSLIMQRVL